MEVRRRVKFWPWPAVCGEWDGGTWARVGCARELVHKCGGSCGTSGREKGRRRQGLPGGYTVLLRAAAAAAAAAHGRRALRCP